MGGAVVYVGLFILGQPNACGPFFKGGDKIILLLCKALKLAVIFQTFA